MLKFILIGLVISWSHTEIKADVTFIPAKLRHSDTQVQLDATYDLGVGNNADLLQWFNPGGDRIFLWSDLNAPIDGINTGHSFTYDTGVSWCNSLGTYTARVEYPGGPAVETSGTLEADNTVDAIVVEADGTALINGGSIEVSSIRGAVKCSAHWTSNNLAVRLREGDNAENTATIPQTPSDGLCTYDGEVEVDYDFTGAEGDTKQFTCTVQFEGGTAVVFQGSVTYNANPNPDPDNGGDGGDNGGDANGGDNGGDANGGDNGGDGNGGDNGGDGNGGDNGGDPNGGDNGGDPNGGDNGGDPNGGDGDGGGDGHDNDHKDGGLYDWAKKHREHKNASSGIHTGVHTMVLLMSLIWMIQKMF